MSDKHETTGTVFLIQPAETRGTFTFRRFVLETADNPRYPQYVEFQTTRDNIDKLDDFEVGDEIRVSFNLRGREWTSPKGEVKYFNTLDAWRIEHAGAAPSRARGGAHEQQPPAQQPLGVGVDDDIPF